jgi:H+/Cl- antiporter ClcA
MVTIGFISLGFQGGEVTPLFSIGACLGAFLSIIFNLDTPACIAIGFVSVFVGATNGYLCGIILCIELFNYKIAIVIASLLLLKNISQFKKSIYT